MPSHALLAISDLAIFMNVIIMRHLEADPLEAAFDVEALVGLGAIQDTLSPKLDTSVI